MLIIYIYIYIYCDGRKKVTNPYLYYYSISLSLSLSLSLARSLTTPLDSSISQTNQTVSTIKSQRKIWSDKTIQSEIKEIPGLPNDFDQTITFPRKGLSLKNY